MKKKILLVISFVITLMNTHAKIITHKERVYIAVNPEIQIDINKDGLWDVSFISMNGGKQYIKLAMRDANNQTYMNFISSTTLTPFSFPKNSDMNSSGKWFGSDGKSFFQLDGFKGQGVRYIGIALLIKGNQHCGWIEITDEGSGTSSVVVTSFAWQNTPNSSCILAGESENNVSISNQLTKSISIYPIPASNELYINGLQTKNKITIYNYLGLEVLNSTIDNNGFIDVSNLTVGVYFVIIELNPKEFLRRKILIER